MVYLTGKLGEFSDFITEPITLTIVDVTTGNVLGSYEGNFGMVEWSPDGNKLLYEDALSNYKNYGVAFTDAPCILFLNLAEKRCLRAIPRLVPDGHQLVTTGSYEWAPDNQTILYAYIYETQGNWLGKLCIYSLVTGYINCPVENLEAINGMTIGAPDISPDQQFIHFCYSASSMLNDYVDTGYDGLIRVDGTGFFSWVGATHDGGPFETCSVGTLWRPSP